MTRPRLILASGSPQRRRLMEQAGYAFQVVTPHESVEQGLCSNCGPAELVADLAAAKALDVADQLQQKDAVGAAASHIVACDTVAECGGQILGKPTDEEHARAMLELLRGTRHRVFSGLCIWLAPRATKLPAAALEIAVSELTMDDIGDAEIDEYLASGLWEGKAGALGYQDRQGWLHLASGSASNVIGLPMELLTSRLPPERAGRPAPIRPQDGP